MIKTRQDLKRFLAADLARYGNVVPSLKDWLLHNEYWYIYHYKRELRFVEYHWNNNNRIRLYWHYFLFKRLSSKMHLTIAPNSIEEGLQILHIGGFTHIGANTHIGKNCTILPEVVFGNKDSNIKFQKIEVGNNCYFGLGAKIFGPVKIGNNVTVGANSIITKDIPDNVVVGGIPAKIINFK